MSREFFKETRRKNFDDLGSVRLTLIEQEAYRVIVTFEAVDIDGFRYRNFKYLPTESFLGYATVFEGASVLRADPLRWNLQRLSDTRNTLLWNYYAAGELGRLVVSSSELNAKTVVEEVAEGVPPSFSYVLQLVDPVVDSVDSAVTWVLDKFGDDETQPGGTDYTPPPVDSPHPTVIKVKTDIPMRFSLIVDSWYLVNPAAFITGGLVDSDEATDGEDEFGGGPDGTGNEDGGERGDGEGSSLDPNSDPRDKDIGGIPGSLTEQGKQYKIIYNFEGRTWSNDGSEQFSFSSEDQEYQPLNGPISRVFTRLFGDAPYGPSNYELIADTENQSVIIRSGSSATGYVGGTVGAFNIRYEEI
jgi:hypothetical protein